MDIVKASQILGVESKVLREFEVLDLYNPPNILKGYLCMQSDNLYGTLVIYSVNGLIPSNPQIIYGTPKLHYPFHMSAIGTRIYNWPKFNRVKAFEKYDGTNILSYSYRDFMGKRYCTFKTRLTPIVRCVDTDSVNFKVLWDEILGKYPELRAPEAVMSGEYAFSYEMYGYKNPIVVMYNEPIEASFIFAVKQSNGEIEPPEKFKHTKIINKCLANAGSDKDLTKLYEAMREQARAKILIQDDGAIYGCEGAVLYVFAEEKWQMFKVKPDVIEQIHWAGDSVDYHSIVSTARNALENISVDELTTLFVVTLLKEEFSDIQIEKSRVRIGKAIKAVKDHVYFLTFVRKIYDNCPDINKGDKGTLMRYFSQYCQKNQMRPVFTALKEMGFVQ